MTALATAISIAEEAGVLVRAGFGSGMESRQKGHFDIVTATDVAVSQLMVGRLQDEFPGDAIVCEEAGRLDGSPDRQWYIDPLDGTKNFAHGLAHCCTMLALEVRGELEVAVIHDPLRGETFTAERGHGAYLNGLPIRVSATASLKDAMVTSGFPSAKRHADLDPAPFFRVGQNVQGLRRTGCTGLDLAYVACGRFDALWDWGLEIWDLAAGLLLVQEAGGVCSDWGGSPYRLGAPGLIAAGPGIHGPLSTCLTVRDDSPCP
jgi:myo-inositol-1(or 4)-monophosphatase